MASADNASFEFLTGELRRLAERAAREESARRDAERELLREREAKRKAEEAERQNSTICKRARYCAQLKRLGLKAKGTTEELEDRCRQENLSKKELKDLLRARGLLLGGSKTELEQRLGDARRKDDRRAASSWQRPLPSQAHRGFNG